MAIVTSELDPSKNDAVFDLDGTIFKFTVLEEYTKWLCAQAIFEPMPREVDQTKLVWKRANTEKNYNAHLKQLVLFFIAQIANKSVATLQEAANIVAAQQAHRQWEITRNIVEYLRATHNVMSISLMPEWLMKPFAEDLGFVAHIGSTYVAREGRFTGEAYSIDKATAYSDLRPGKTTSMLDVHMGDTVGDASLFDISRRPILFNPSWTLLSSHGTNRTMIGAHKDVVQVVEPNTQLDLPGKLKLFGPPYDVASILKAVAIQKT